MPFLCKAELHSLECALPILFSRLSIDGPMGCFHLWPLWMMLPRTRVCTSLSDTLLSVLWGCRPRSRIAGSHGNVLFNFFSNPHTIFLGNCPILYSASNAQGFPFLHIPTHTSYFLFVHSSPPRRCEVVSHSGFDLHFPGDE